MDVGRLTARLTSSLAALVLTLGTSACAHQESAPDDDGAHRPGSAAIADDRRDRRELSRLTTLLGDPLPSPAADDDVGIEQPAFDVTRAYTEGAPRLAGRQTRLRATAWKRRVHTLELTFSERCDAACARSLVATLEGWVGPMNAHQEGRVRFLSADNDTVHVMLEVYPSRPELTRLVLRCAPLWSASQGRALRLPDFGEAPPREENPRCRPLPP